MGIGGEAARRESLSPHGKAGMKNLSDEGVGGDGKVMERAGWEVFRAREEPELYGYPDNKCNMQNEENVMKKWSMFLAAAACACVLASPLQAAERKK